MNGYQSINNRISEKDLYKLYNTWPEGRKDFIVNRTQLKAKIRITTNKWKNAKKTENNTMQMVKQIQKLVFINTDKLDKL